MMSMSTIAYASRVLEVEVKDEVKDEVQEEVKGDINRRDKDGNTPLFAAATFGDMDQAKELIENGADVNIPSKSGNTPLIQACWQGNREMVEYLVEQGSKIDTVNKYGATAAIYAACYGSPELVTFLITKGADIFIADKQGHMIPAFSEEVQDAVDEGISYLNQKTAELLPVVEPVLTLHMPTEVIRLIISFHYPDPRPILKKLNSVMSNSESCLG